MRREALGRPSASCAQVGCSAGPQDFFATTAALVRTARIR
eukprot:CAMPEP_0176289390 /NCGR_PEP_ID=MMETSP0121_2-20121125/54471_1 /TAXON_ID=160619 /ORGANISM="Kryptoperidinium foliaceum, Strain CCMP 1326" /LENGTH=39 /DNA_ID= /DNA_START= /DNA_END= /DNA_ORIENTATION=